MAPADDPRPTRADDDHFAAQLRGFGPIGILAILLIALTGNFEVAPMVFIPVGALLTFAWVRASKTPWREIGYFRPKSWARTIVLGVASGIVLKLLMKSVVLPLLGADPINRSYQFLAGNTAMLPLAVIAMLNAGFAEETTTRGFLFERFGKGIGTSVWARVATVLITSIYFGLGHTSQGFWGVVQGTMTGLVFGTTYALTGNLFLVMITHASFDLTALALIYSGNEARVAHWFVR